jgi:hypothetical protein
MNKLYEDYPSNKALGAMMKTPNIKIWIASDLCYTCHGHYNWFHKMMLKLLLGWKVTKVKND